MASTINRIYPISADRSDGTNIITEANIANHIKNLFNNVKGFIVKYNSSTRDISFYLGGYYIEATLDSSDAAASALYAQLVINASDDHSETSYNCLQSPYVNFVTSSPSGIFLQLISNGNVHSASYAKLTQKEIDVFNNLSTDRVLITNNTGAVTTHNQVTGGAGTKCKITYDALGLVTEGADLQASDIPALAADKITSGTFDADRIPAATTTKKGAMPKISSTVSTQTQLTEFLREDGTWSVPSYTVDTWRAIKVGGTQKLDNTTTGGALNFVSQNTNNGDVSFTYDSGIKATAKIPTSLKNPNVITIQGNGADVSTYDGSVAKTFNWKPSATAGAFEITAGDITETVQLAGAFTDTATAVDDILEGSNSGTAITYKPYVSKGAGHFYTGSTLPSNTNRLNYDGYFYATQIYATSFTASSDYRLKENIKDWAPKKSILDLPIKEFDFKDTKSHHIGCLAQDLQKICPEVVYEGDDGYLGIEESKLVYLLLDEVKKLKKEIDELKEGK